MGRRLRTLAVLATVYTVSEVMNSDARFERFQPIETDRFQPSVNPRLVHRVTGPQRGQNDF
jgi:hypothetical protein